MRLAELILLGIFVTSTPTLAQDDRSWLYWQFDGGSSYFTDSEIDRDEVSFEEGWSVGHRIGFASEGGSLGVEVGLHKGQGLTQDDREVDPLVLAFTIDGALNIIRTDWIDWYVGVGGGVAGSINGDGDSGSAPLNTLHAETGLIIKPTRSVQFVPHVRSIAIQDVADGSQFIHTARLGVRFNLR